MLKFSWNFFGIFSDFLRFDPQFCCSFVGFGCFWCFGLAIFCYVARRGGDVVRTVSLLKLKAIACMKAVN